MSGNLPEIAKLTLLRSMAAVKKAIVGKHVEAMLIRSKNGLLLVDVEDQKVGRHLAYEGEYGLDDLQRLLGIVAPDDTVLIVGAHVGSLAIAASKACRRLIAVEANPRTFSLLQYNLLINGCSNVVAINTAAGDKEEQIQFVASRVNSGGSKKMPANMEYRYFYDSPKIINIPAKPLDSVLTNIHVDVILMDIEGSEYIALKGMQRTLGQAKYLLMEFIPNHLKDISGVSTAAFVEALGDHFATLEIPSKGMKVDRSEFTSVLQKMYDHGECDFGLLFAK